jgi:hypothetical protein
VTALLGQISAFYPAEIVLTFYLDRYMHVGVGRLAGEKLCERETACGWPGLDLLS